MCNNVLDVCRYVINYSNDENYGISNLKLQKILYFIQAYFLSYTEQKEPCFSEKIEAWDFGPVVPKAYHEFKQYGSGDIPKISSYIEYEDDDIWNVERKAFDENCIDKEKREIINQIVDRFSEYTATDLVELTHNQDPWKNSYEKYMNNEITNESIRGYFDEQ